MKLYCLKKYILGLVCVLLLLQLGCCKRKSLDSTGSARQTSVIESDKTEEDSSDSEVFSSPKRTSFYSRPADYSTTVVPRISSNHIFEKRYFAAVELLDNDELGKAYSAFQDLLKEFPEGEEVSVILFCIAEIHFKNKNNKAAWDLYKEIIKKYPGTQAAQNAAEGIKYLESFDRHEATFVSPDAQNKDRRR